jgi:hypothetical protein
VGQCNVIRAFADNGARSSVGEGALPDPERHYARATEFLEVVNALFDMNDSAAARRTAAGSVSVESIRPRAAGSTPCSG